MIPEPESRNCRTTLRPVLPDDVGFLESLYASTREDIADTPLSADQKSALISMQFLAQDNHYRLLFPTGECSIILEQGEPVGRLSVARSEEEIRLIDIALLPEFRQRGLGSEILGNLLAEGAMTRKPVRLRVEPDSRALRLYQRLGFSTVADERTHLHLECRPPAVRRGAGV